jgi:hypothetical protein
VKHTHTDAVATLEAGLSVVRPVADAPLLWATEYEGWFFYGATPVSGFAIKKGGRDVVSWSVW